MGYTVEDLIKSNEFSGIKIINNLYETNREIKGAQFVSMADIENSGGGGKLLLTSLRVYDNLDKNTVIYHLEEFNKKGVSGFVVKRRNDTVPPFLTVGYIKKGEKCLFKGVFLPFKIVVWEASYEIFLIFLLRSLG